MKIYTLQLAKWRKSLAQGIPYIDTTVKSGDPTFAPSWEIVMAVKKGEISEEEYTETYKQLMRDSYKNNRPKWDEVSSMDKVTVCCYCPEGCFCHRYLLVDMFRAHCKQNSIDFEYCGELLSI